MKNAFTVLKLIDIRRNGFVNYMKQKKKRSDFLCKKKGLTISIWRKNLIFFQSQEMML